MITLQVIVPPVCGATSVDLRARNALIRAQVLLNPAEHPKVPLLTVKFQLKSTTSFVNALILNSNLNRFACTAVTILYLNHL